MKTITNPSENMMNLWYFSIDSLIAYIGNPPRSFVPSPKGIGILLELSDYKVVLKRTLRATTGSRWSGGGEGQVSCYSEAIFLMKLATTNRMVPMTIDAPAISQNRIFGSIRIKIPPKIKTAPGTIRRNPPPRHPFIPLHIDAIGHISVMLSPLVIPSIIGVECSMVSWVLTAHQPKGLRIVCSSTQYSCFARAVLNIKFLVKWTCRL